MFSDGCAMLACGAHTSFVARRTALDEVDAKGSFKRTLHRVFCNCFLRRIRHIYTTWTTPAFCPHANISCTCAQIVPTGKCACAPT